MKKHWAIWFWNVLLFSTLPTAQCTWEYPKHSAVCALPSVPLCLFKPLLLLHQCNVSCHNVHCAKFVCTNVSCPTSHDMGLLLLLEPAESPSGQSENKLFRGVSKISAAPACASPIRHHRIALNCHLLSFLPSGAWKIQMLAPRAVDTEGGGRLFAGDSFQACSLPTFS